MSVKRGVGVGVYLFFKECCFRVKVSHDDTKIETKKLPILFSFYFHEVLQQLHRLVMTDIFGSKVFFVLR